MNFQLSTITFFIIGLFALACGHKSDEALEIQEYSGPIREVGPAVNYYSDSAVVIMKMEAPRQLDFANEDSEFPEGISLEFYEEGKLASTLRADYCYKTGKDQLWKANGNVVIKGLINGDQLNTEELYWDQKEDKVYTDKYVMIQRQGDLIEGIGLEAKPDFTYYRILEVTGERRLNEPTE